MSLVLLTVLLLPAPGRSAQDGLPPRQMEILQTVLSVEGFLTKELHSEFWASVPSAILNDAKMRTAFDQLINRSIAATVIFQRESWASMKASLEAGRIVKSPGYAMAKKNMLSVSSIPQIKDQLQTALGHAEGMIKAAGEGTVYHSTRGPVHITHEMVDGVLAGLNASIARLRRLTNPDWEATATEHHYPDAHVAILSQVPFAVEREELTAENGRKVTITTLASRINETDFLSVTFSAYGGVWADPEGAAIRTVKAALEAIGASPSVVYSSRWRNRLSASGSGTANSADGMFYTSTRVVEMRDYGGALSFTAVTTTSKINAENLRKRLERSTRILR